MSLRTAIFCVAFALLLMGCGDEENPTPLAAEVKIANEFVSADSVPAEFLGKRELETWSQWSVSFAVGLYINDRPASPKPPDAKHVSPFVKRADGKISELLVSHKVSRWDSARSSWLSSWRWTLLKIVEPGKLQVFHASPGRDDRPATLADIPVILEKKPRIVELR